MATALANARLWHRFKLFSAVKDIPEVAILAGLVSSALGLGLYTMRHMYFSRAGGVYPSVDVRHDYDKQLEVDEEYAKKPWMSVMHRVAEARTNDKGCNMRIPGLWSNNLLPYNDTFIVTRPQTDGAQEHNSRAWPYYEGPFYY